MHHVPACVGGREREREGPADRQTDRQKQSRSRKREGDLDVEGLAASATAVGKWESEQTVIHKQTQSTPYGRIEELISKGKLSKSLETGSPRGRADERGRALVR